MMFLTFLFRNMNIINVSVMLRNIHLKIGKTGIFHEDFNIYIKRKPAIFSEDFHIFL